MIQITAENIHTLLHYDPETGIFTWLPRTPDMFDAGGFRAPEHNCAIWNARYAGKATGSPNGKGYLTIVIGGKHYEAQRLAHAAYCEASGRLHGEFSRVA